MPDVALSPVEALNLFAKVLAYSAALASVGALAFLDTFRSDLLDAEVATLKRHMSFLMVLAAVAMVVRLYATVAYLNGRGIAGGFDSELWGLVVATATGEAVVVRAVGLLILLTGLLVDRLRFIAALAGGLVIAASFGFVGHVQDDEHSQLLHALLMLHLLAISFWIGSLWPLLRVARAPSPQRVARIMDRFGRLAVYFVTCLLGAGVVLAAFLLEGISPLFSTSYGRVLLAKLALVALLLGFAAMNKWRFVPALAVGDRAAGGRLQRSICIEVVLVVLILFATGLLTSRFSPP